MKWLIDNWSFLVVILCGVVAIIVYLNRFIALPTGEQLNKVKQWLLYAVIEAEKQYKGGTGALKLRAVYNEFCKVFPSLVPIVSFAVFSELVDEALEQMRHLLETNMDITYYVESGGK
jgi:hypothetical protein